MDHHELSPAFRRTTHHGSLIEGWIILAEQGQFGTFSGAKWHYMGFLQGTGQFDTFSGTRSVWMTFLQGARVRNLVPVSLLIMI